MLRQALDWLDERTGYRRLLSAVLDEPLPGGSRWMYVTGSGLLFALVLQAVTGVALAMYFSPSTTDAWGSVLYLQTRVTLGWLVRGIHHFGASAMVVLAVIHMVQVFVVGAYKRPRELNWMTGVVLLFLVLGFSLTGYLLPWDQRGYWATQVATRIMGGAPVAGPWLQTLLQGGADYGNLTLTRFYALHVFVLPALATGLVILHVALFRRHGVTPSWRLSPARLAAAEPFWPAQVLKDTTWMAVILATLVALAALVGAPLDAPADPSSTYDARPEWYFLFLFQLLKYFEGPAVLVGTVVIPTACAAFLLLLPFLDRAPSRSPRHRKPWVLGFFGLLGGAVALTGLAVRDDHRDAAHQAHRITAAEQADLAKTYAAIGGIDAEGEVILYRGHRLFEDRGCLTCHAISGRKEPVQKRGFELTGFLSRRWFHDFLMNPDGPAYCGGLKCEGVMPAQADLGQEKLIPLVELLASQSGLDLSPPIDADLARKGMAVFEGEVCTTCHTFDGTALVGPTLGKFGTRRHLRDFLEHPDAPHHFGDFNAMPSFADLPPNEKEHLVAYLRHLHTLSK